MPMRGGFAHLIGFPWAAADRSPPLLGLELRGGGGFNFIEFLALGRGTSDLVRLAAGQGC